MSFGFSVRDIVGTAQLAYNLHKRCYKVARDAPLEFKLLVTELRTIRISTDLSQGSGIDLGERWGRKSTVGERTARTHLRNSKGTKKACGEVWKLESSRLGLKRA